VKGGEPPEELWLAWQAKRWGYTPTEVMEQPAGLLTRMAIAWDAYEQAARDERALEEFEGVPVAQKAQWLSAHPRLAEEWMRRNGIKDSLAAFRQRQLEKKARING